MVEKTKQKLIASLSQKKIRDKTGLFVAEGPKLVKDLLAAGIEAEMILATPSYLKALKFPPPQTEAIDDTELRKLSFLKTPQGVLAIFRKPAQTFSFGDHANQLTLCLDGIQDPGNMGTILRLADWFGISTIICSNDTTDIYNPKVVQASMGALARVTVHYTELSDFCRQSVSQFHLPVFGTFMDGENIYTSSLPSKGLIIMGNEGGGIRSETEKTVTKRLTIPGFPNHKSSMESLNVGVATAVVCSEFRRSGMITQQTGTSVKSSII
jgi:TrmH family RNA methyltransferase